MKESTPKVSIVIPVYNGANYLQEAIDSALAQTYRNLEVVVVNDGSKDAGATERIAKSYGNKIRYYSKTNGGVASALNLAIKEMAGDYFSWLSHDDLYAKEKVERQIKAVQQLGRDDVVIYCDFSVFTTDAEKAIPVFLRGVPPELFRYWITAESSLHGCSLLIPRNAFEKVGVFDDKLRTTQDMDLWFRMAGDFSFIHLPEVLVKSRRHSDQGSNRMSDIARKECDELFTHFISELKAEEILAATGEPLDKAYAEFAARWYNRGFKNASALAEKFARQNSGQFATVIRNIGYLWNRSVNLGSKLMPVGIKQVIRIGLLRINALRR